MKVFLRLVTANLKETLRDFMLLFWFVLFPVVFALVFGLLFSNLDNGTAENVNSSNYADNGFSNYDSYIFDVGLVSEDKGELADEIIETFKSISMFRVHTGAREDEINEFESGRRNLVVILPEGLSESETIGSKSEIHVYHDMYGVALLYGVSEIMNGVERGVTSRPQLFEIVRHDNFSNTGAVETTNDVNDEENSKGKEVATTQHSQIDYTLPGVLAITLMQLGLFGSLRILSLKSQKTLKSLGATPLPRSLFLASEVFVRLLMAVIQALIIIVLGHFLFNLTLSSNFFLIFGWVILGVSVFVSLGYMLTTFAKTVDSGNGLMQVVQFPMMFLSGIFIPPEVMPQFLKPVVKLIPLSYLADGLRNVMTGTPSSFGLTTDFIVLISVIMVSMTLAVTRFRWE